MVVAEWARWRRSGAFAEQEDTELSSMSSSHRGDVMRSSAAFAEKVANHVKRLEHEGRISMIQCSRERILRTRGAGSFQTGETLLVRSCRAHPRHPCYVVLLPSRRRGRCGSARHRAKHVRPSSFQSLSA